MGWQTINIGKRRLLVLATAFIFAATCQPVQADLWSNLSDWASGAYQWVKKAPRYAYDYVSGETAQVEKKRIAEELAEKERIAEKFEATRKYAEKERIAENFFREKKEEQDRERARAAAEKKQRAEKEQLEKEVSQQQEERIKEERLAQEKLEKEQREEEQREKQEQERKKRAEANYKRQKEENDKIMEKMRREKKEKWLAGVEEAKAEEARKVKKKEWLEQDAIEEKRYWSDKDAQELARKEKEEEERKKEELEAATRLEQEKKMELKNEQMAQDLLRIAAKIQATQSLSSKVSEKEEKAGLGQSEVKKEEGKKTTYKTGDFIRYEDYLDTPAVVKEAQDRQATVLAAKKLEEKKAQALQAQKRARVKELLHGLDVSIAEAEKRTERPQKAELIEGFEVLKGDPVVENLMLENSFNEFIEKFYEKYDQLESAAKNAGLAEHFFVRGVGKYDIALGAVIYFRVRNDHKLVNVDNSKDVELMRGQVRGLMCFFFAVAVIKDEGFIDGTFIVQDKNAAIFNLLMDLGGASRIASHLKHAKMSWYGVNVDFLPVNKSTILFGQLEPVNKQGFLFVKMEDHGVVGDTPIETILNIAAHTMGYLKSLLAKSNLPAWALEILKINNDDYFLFRKERFSEKSEIYKLFKVVVDDSRLTPAQQAKTLSKALADGVSYIYEQVFGEESQGESTNMELEKKIDALKKAMEEFDHLDVRIGREVIIDNNDFKDPNNNQGQ